MQILYRPMNGDPTLVAAEPDWASCAGMPLDLDGARSRYVELTRRWAQIHGIAEAALVRELDVEDWCESAVRIVAAVDTGLPVHVLRRCRDFREIAFERSINTDGGFDPEGPSIFTGSFLKQDPVFPYRIRGEDPNPANLVWPDGARHWVGNHYWRDETLMNALGRHARLSTGNSGGPDGYVETTRRLVGDGADRVLAKIVFQSKYRGPTEIVLPRDAGGRPSVSDRDIESGYFRAFEETLMDCDERQECFLVQEVRPMVAEYRVVVADGRPVAGAGCVEKLSPIFHDPGDGPFDPVVEGKRNRGGLERRPDLAARYAGRASELCAEHEANGVDEFRNCTMDFCLDADTREVLLVETNAMENFGLYAMDFRPVMAAAVAEAKQNVEARAAPVP